MMNVLKKIAALNFTTIQPCWNSGLDDKHSYCRSGVRLMSTGTVVAEFVDFGHSTEVKELLTHVFKDNGDGNVTIFLDVEVLESLFQRDKAALNEMFDSIYSNDLEYFGRVTARLVNARELKYWLANGKTWTQAVEKVKGSTEYEIQVENLKYLEELIHLVNVLRSKTSQKALTAVHEKICADGSDEFVEVRED